MVLPFACSSSSKQTVNSSAPTLGGDRNENSWVLPLACEHVSVRKVEDEQDDGQNDWQNDAKS
jgi:hypothetical protein